MTRHINDHYRWITGTNYRDGYRYAVLAVERGGEIVAYLTGKQAAAWLAGEAVAA